MARVDARLEHIDRELTELRRSDLEQRVSTLERVVDEELRPLLSTIAAKLDGVHWAVKIIGGSMGLLLIGLQIYNILQG